MMGMTSFSTNSRAAWRTSFSRSEEHTSELQSRLHLVCRLLLGKKKMVAVGDDDTIQMIDAKTQTVVDSLPSGPDPELFAQDAAGKFLYVANEKDNTVTVIDLENHEVTEKINFYMRGLRNEAIQPVCIGMTRDDKTAFIALGPANRIAVVHTASRNMTKYLLFFQ